MELDKSDPGINESSKKQSQGKSKVRVVAVFGDTDTDSQNKTQDLPDQKRVKSKNDQKRILIDDFIRRDEKSDAQSDSESHQKKKVNPLLKELLRINEDIKKRKKSKVQELKPIIWRNGHKVLFPNTIMAIQGPSGSGKTRLAQAMIAAFLSDKPKTKGIENLSFRAESKDIITVLIDTERNLNDQMPKAIQEIQYLAGIPREEDPENLEYISILNIPRNQRLQAIQVYVQFLQQLHEEKHLVIFLDVLTDLVQDFNEPGECLNVIDYLNRLINNHNCTIVCVIHENPGTTKMRGHLGTELSNKASTILQITHKDTGPADILLRYIKCRNSKRYPDFYAEFNEESSTLREVDPSQVDKAANNIKATKGEVTRFLSTVGFPVSRRDILDQIMSEFEISESTAESRLKEVWEGKTSIKQGGKNYILKKEKEGGSLEYQLLEEEGSNS